ncbi:shikimate dehydrogenase [uncultured Campylobacter sp.]|uniref:shikimate dehydrogenase n=1 Tax=uncultured Campylobacter sp. TaxID=218934 RepID=UPI00260DA733|nr:shikimate dehydrogenase [uncultured Campylobacter sp.]
MKIFAVFGNPVSHSISPRLHNAALGELGLSSEALYTRYELMDGSKLIYKFKELKLSGANVTVPHKEAALAQCDVADETAIKIGSVNTLVSRSGKIYGHNTDAPGFLRAIESFGEIKSALVLGAGGTAKAVAYALKSCCVRVCVLNRSEGRLANFAEYENFSWANFAEFKGGKFDLVVNTTSAGLKDEILPAPTELLRPIFDEAKFAFDVIYGKKTPFLNLAAASRLAHKDGLDMLLFQAALALNLFFDGSLDEAKIQAAMQKALRLG